MNSRLHWRCWYLQLSVPWPFDSIMKALRKHYWSGLTKPAKNFKITFTGASSCASTPCMGMKWYGVSCPKSSLNHLKSIKFVLPARQHKINCSVPCSTGSVGATALQRRSVTSNQWAARSSLYPSVARSLIPSPPVMITRQPIQHSLSPHLKLSWITPVIGRWWHTVKRDSTRPSPTPLNNCMS